MYSPLAAKNSVEIYSHFNKLLTFEQVLAVMSSNLAPRNNLMSFIDPFTFYLGQKSPLVLQVAPVFCLFFWGWGAGFLEDESCFFVTVKYFKSPIEKTQRKQTAWMTASPSRSGHLPHQVFKSWLKKPTPILFDLFA